jgi:hypothetical protein
MKRLLSVSLLMLCLSFTAFAGHTIGRTTYCNCSTAGCLEDYPGECSGYLPMGARQNDSPNDPTAELGIAIVALLLWLRLRA